MFLTGGEEELKYQPHLYRKLLQPPRSELLVDIINTGNVCRYFEQIIGLFVSMCMYTRMVLALSTWLIGLFSTPLDHLLCSRQLNGANKGAIQGPVDSASLVHAFY